MTQSRTMSVVESVANIGSGMLVSLALWEFVAPLYGIESTHSNNLQFVAMFTVVSLIRSYIWRRLFTRIS